MKWFNTVHYCSFPNHTVIIIYSDTIWKVTVNMNATWKDFFSLWASKYGHMTSSSHQESLISLTLEWGLSGKWLMPNQSGVSLLCFPGCSCTPFLVCQPTVGHAGAVSFLMWEHSSHHNGKWASPNQDHNGGSMGKRCLKYQKAFPVHQHRNY